MMRRRMVACSPILIPRSALIGPAHRADAGTFNLPDAGGCGPMFLKLANGTLAMRSVEFAPSRRSVVLGGTAVLAACARAPLAGALLDDEKALAWRPLSPMPATAQEIYPALWRGEIVVAGGFTRTGGRLGVSDRLFIYSPSTDTWREGPSLPTPRHHPHLLVSEDTLFVVGGFEAPGSGRIWEMKRTGWQWDDASEQWLGAPILPRAVGEAVPLSMGGRLHVIGGRSPVGQVNANWNDHGDVAHHYVLEAGERVWREAASAPTARNSAAGVVLDGKIYVVGGRRVNAGSNTETEMYDPATDQWSSLAPMPQGQGGLAAGVIEGKIAAFGGEFFNPGDGGVHAETWLYDPARDLWEAGPDMLTPRHGLGGVTIADQIYALGGATMVGADGTSAALDVLSLT